MRFDVFTRIRIGLLAVIATAILPAGVSLAQMRVTATTPRANEINVVTTGTISVTFSDAVNLASLTADTWLVSGSQTGYYQGQFAYDAASRTATFTPNFMWRDGEVITFVLTSGITSTGGLPLAPIQRAFTVAVEFGTGIFDERIDIALDPNADNPAERNPSAIFAADFDKDQYTDLAIVNSTNNTVTILRNRLLEPDGTMSIENVLPVGSGPTAITGGDFDRDGYVDLAVSNFDDNTISVLRGTGGSDFISVQTVPTHEHPTQLDARDFNGDGQMDLAVVVLGVNQLQVFLNQGGSFSPAASTYATGASPYGLSCGDFDNDDDVDIVVTNTGDNTIIVYKNNGSGAFTNSGEIQVPEDPTTIRAGDLAGRSTGAYGDGILDLAIAHANYNEISILTNRTLDGGFVVEQRFDVGLRPTDLFIGDVDTTDATALQAGFGKDHDLDVAVPNLFSNDVFLIRNQFNNNFQFNNRDIYEAGETPSSITGADFDRDGDIDLAVTNLTTHSASILLNQGGKGSGLQFTLPPTVFDFGQVYLGTDSTRFLRLYNPTEETITVDEISNRLPQFTPSVTNATIAPGELFVFAVTFAPTDTVVYEDTLRVHGLVGAQEQNLTLALRGEGIQAIISVVPDTLDFGTILPPQTATLPITITNSGNGAIKISDFQFTNPVFSAPFGSLEVPPYSSQQVDITFIPTLPQAYLDTLLIVNNDSLNTPVPVILMGGPNVYPPLITSADTVIAIEDSFFTYVATVSDSDGTQPEFVFSNLPGWLSPTTTDLTNNSVSGTPREGDRDTTFTVIARDGVFSDTLNVYVRVIPVNDPPVFDPIADQTTTELSLLSFNISATDPEDSTLAFVALGLPAGAFLTDNSNNTANFSWIPPAGSRGVYTVTFVVSEVYETPSLSDTIVVQITVLEALADLVAASLSIPTTDIAEDQRFPVTGVVRADYAAVDTPFRLTFYHDGQIVRDTVVTQIAFEQELNFTYRALFDRVGSHEIRFEVDVANQVAESNEENNTAMLLLQVRKPEVVVRPNPFTPNSDGYNDEAIFDFSDLPLIQPELKIFSFKGQVLMTLNTGLNSVFRWNGRDDSGKEQKPGIYLYVLSDQQARIASGYVVLAR